MQKLLLSLSLLTLVLFAAAQKVINDPNAEVRSAPAFHSIHISSAFDVLLTQGSEEKVVVSADDQKYLPDIITTVNNGILTIEFKENRNFWHIGNRKLKAYLSVKNLNEIRLSGATTLKIDGNLMVDNFNLHLSGASTLRGNLTVNGKLNTDLNGASDLYISGSANEMDISASGASDIKAFDFTTGICDVQASGASTVQISVNKELSASLSGASSVHYKGTASIKNIKTSGASNVNHKS